MFWYLMFPVKVFLEILVAYMPVYNRSSNTTSHRQTVSCTHDIGDVNEMNCPALSIFTFGLKCVMLDLRKGLG